VRHETSARHAANVARDMTDTNEEVEHTEVQPISQSASGTASPSPEDEMSPTSRAAFVLDKWQEEHEGAATIIQRYARGRGSRKEFKLRRVATQVAKREQVITRAKKKGRVSARLASVAPDPNSVASDAVQDDALVSLRILKVATIGFKGMDLDQREACKSSGKYKYEVILEKVNAEDIGNLLIGWGSAVSEEESWRTGIANGETPQFDAQNPCLWWGPVFNRAQLTSDERVMEDTTVVICVTVDLDRTTPKCWFNLFIDTSDLPGMELESIYPPNEDSDGGWQSLELTGFRKDAEGPQGLPSGEEDPTIFPVISLSSSASMTINFGQRRFDCDSVNPPPGVEKYEGVLGAPPGEKQHPSPVAARKLITLGGSVLSIDYQEKMSKLIEMAAQRGSWEIMRLILSGRWNEVPGKLSEDDERALDAESLMHIMGDSETKPPSAHRVLTMTNRQSKTLIHIAIEYKRFGFVDNLFDWLPPGEDKEVAKLDNSIDIELLMSAERKLLVTQDLDGCNPLLIAIVNGQDKMATRILAKVWPLRPCSNVAAAAPHVPRCTVNPRLCVVCMCAIRSAGDRSG
jgi:hypothetical protein